jgi:hypothetical protein
MKQKVYGQDHPRQPRMSNAQVQQEIHNFLRALDSYPARAAKEPRVSFHQHLCSLFATDQNQRESRARRP